MSARGSFFAFLGVNGAGKSTTISIICGQLDEDAGNVTVCGESIEHGLDKIARRLGVVFQNSVLDQACFQYVIISEVALRFTV